MNILFLGLGSIGQRHLINVKKIFKRAKFYAFRKKNSNLIIKNVKVKKKLNLSKYYKLETCKSLKEAKKIKPSITFICNPSSFHLRDAKIFAQEGSHLFIEKPLLGNNIEIKKLANTLKSKSLNSMVGFQLRFHPAIILTKKIINEKKYGKVKTAYFDNLTHLPSHHPYEDYSKGYAARKSLGGGSLSSLIHEVDLIAYFFSKPYKLISKKYNSGVIKCDTDDNFFSIMEFKKNNHKFLVNLNLSFTNVFEKREFRILFEKSLLVCDLIKNKINIYSNKTKKIVLSKNFKFQRNKLFFDEIKSFKKSIKSKKENFLSVKNNQDTSQLFNLLNNSKLIN